ncbi:MAG: GNAT family N-acetyltransferase [Lysinibacillus sp.]
MEIKLVAKTDHQQVHRLRDYCFTNKYVGARREDFQHWIEHSTTIGAYDVEKLVGQVLVLPLNMTVHGENYDMGGIGFVATYPEYRNRGIMKKLMIRALEEMRENKQYISVLAPYSVSFYRYFGWELFFDKLHYSIQTEAFPQFGDKLDVVKRFSFEWMDEQAFQEVQQFNNVQALKTNGAMVRDAAWWQRIARREPESHFAAYFEEGRIAGYIRYEIKNLIFYVKDFITEDMVAEQALWRFITSHAASVHTIEGITSNSRHFGFQFKQPQFKKEITQDIMVRIVDVLAFCEKYPWKNIEQSLYLSIEDKFGPWNEELFEINKNGKIKIIEANSVDEKHILSISINLFSSMMVGYLTVDEVLFYAKNDLVDDAKQHWKNAISSSVPSFYEYF